MIRLTANSGKKWRTVALSGVGWMCILLFVMMSSAAAMTSPTDCVKGTIDAILIILQDQDLQVPEKKSERRGKVESVVDASFDFR